MSGTITGTLHATYAAAPNPADPNFPTPPGFSYYSTIYGYGFKTFDFGRNLYYPLINHGSNMGFAVYDLSTMTMLRTASLTSMYAGTSFVLPAGSNEMWDIITGNSTDIYLLISPSKTAQSFARVDAGTLKVTGQISGFAGHDLLNGVANKTASHTIVGYQTHPAYHVGLFLLDGTGMAPIGYSTSPVYSSYGAYYLPGGVHPDGSCDFIMIDSDLGGSGLINIWRIRVSNSLAITSTMTGTFDANTVYDPLSGTSASIGQLQYDEANDTIILWLQNDINGPPTWLTSVNWDGSVKWSTFLDIGSAASPSNRGQSQLTDTTMMTGSYNDPLIIDTNTGDVIFTGTQSGPYLDYYFQVWDASRLMWWTYSLSTFGFTRTEFIPPPSSTLTDAELVFQPGASFVDFAVEANRRKLIAVGGTPQFLGSRGEIPFAAQPAVYLTTLGPPTDFAQNNGGGGAFAPTGDIDPATGPGCTPYYFTEAAGPAADPEWRLTVSDDGSRTWSRLVKPRGIGPLGHYKTRLRWLKMGAFRQRSVKLECTDPVRRNIVGVYIDLDQGMS